MSRPKKLSDSELLNVAYDVSGREGFDSFTLRQVSRSADISPAALIKRFKSKKRLVLLARQHRWQSTLDQFRENAPESLRGLRGLFHFVSQVAKSVSSKRLAEHASAFGVDASDIRTRKVVGSYFSATRSLIARLLREAAAQGELTELADPDRLAFTLEALMQGAIFQFAFLGESNIEAHLHAHMHTFLAPYLPNPGKWLRSKDEDPITTARSG